MKNNTATADTYFKIKQAGNRKLKLKLMNKKLLNNNYNYIIM